MSESTEQSEIRPPFWKRWYLLFIFLAVLAAGLGVAGHRVHQAIYESQPQIAGFGWRPDGKAYATSQMDGSLLITVPNGALPATVKMLRRPDGGRWDTSDEKYFRLKWSPDGKYLTGYNGSLLSVWDVAAGKELNHKLPIKTGHTFNYEWDADSRNIWFVTAPRVNGPGPYNIKKFDVEKGDLAQDLNVPHLLVDPGSVSTPIWSKDHSRIAIRLPKTEKPASLAIVDTQNGVQLHKWELKHAYAQLEWSPDGLMLAMVRKLKSAAAFATIDIKDAETGDIKHALEIPYSLIPLSLSASAYPGRCDLAWSEDGKRLGCAIAIYNGTYRNTEECLLTWWNAEDGKLLASKLVQIKGTAYKLEYFSGTPYQFPLYKSWMEYVYWSPDLQSIGISIMHTSWLAVMGSGKGYPTSSYGDYGSVIIEKAPPEAGISSSGAAKP
ncbi:MAG: WD40 repeat domain-containing protein [Candidatus Methylacidiphilales bacterium]